MVMQKHYLSASFKYEDGNKPSLELSMTARVLNTIRSEHEVSRADIARILDCSRLALTSLFGLTL